MNKLKGHFVYNLNYEPLIMVAVIFVLLSLSIVVPSAVITLCLWSAAVIAAVSIVIWRIRKIHLNSHGLKYLSVSPGIIRRKTVWINQRIFIFKKKNPDRKKEFVNNLQHLKETLQEGTTCYCCTHEAIIKKIEKNFKVEKKVKAYKRSLRLEKKIICSGTCKTCPKERKMKCKEKVQFYGIKFVI